jgi:hypothetical protein
MRSMNGCMAALAIVGLSLGGTAAQAGYVEGYRTVGPGTRHVVRETVVRERTVVERPAPVVRERIVVRRPAPVLRERVVVERPAPPIIRERVVVERPAPPIVREVVVDDEPAYVPPAVLPLPRYGFAVTDW